MTWQPITEAHLQGILNDAGDRMTDEQRILWEAVRVAPTKWHLTPWGDQGNGFWVVGVIGNSVLWYNDIEGGFNLSKYAAFGAIDEYWCNQDQLEWTLQSILNSIQSSESPSDC